MSLSLLLNARPETAPRSGAGPRLGSGKAQGWRAPFEFYPTPPAAIRALLSVERFDASVWEPACGNGAIARELASAGYYVVATDIVDWGYGQPGLDFLEAREPLAKHIITNPPYGHGLADDFVQHALILTRKTQGRVAMLLNIASLCHPSRHDRFVQHPPSVIYALDECVCYPLGDPARASTYTLAHRYAWVIWDHGHSGETAFRWLSTAGFRTGMLSQDAQKKENNHEQD